MNIKRTIFLSLLLTNTLIVSANKGSSSKEKISFKFDKVISFAEQQYTKACSTLDITKGMPRNAHADGTWRQTGIRDWVSGFFPGSLWYIYELTGNQKWEKEARKWTEALEDVQSYDGNHDSGFMVYCSYGNGYRLTKDESYKQIILNTSQTLSTRYRPEVGTILSWGNIHQKNPTKHITIIDNMMNLEMLMWASKNGGSKKFADISITHSNTTLKHHFRKDGSSYHGVIYNPKNGEVINKRTYQGYNDETMWARGQSWGIYGYVMMYRETGMKKYLKMAMKCADRCIERLPEDVIPYWDYDAPGIPKREKDASAASIMASAFLEIYEHTGKIEYYNWAVKMLNTLSTKAYWPTKDNYQCIILHSVGHYPGNSEVNVNINYADYYYLEAIVRLKRLTETGSIF
ncbi:glucuronyl hydrolase [Puteibacter caeruleilacunae]|nr:glucuronyl hydrolase [Puteibacter caeruleilacunae]